MKSNIFLSPLIIRISTKTTFFLGASTGENFFLKYFFHVFPILARLEDTDVYRLIRGPLKYVQRGIPKIFFFDSI